MRTLWLVTCGAIVAAGLRAQDAGPLNPPSPFAPAKADASAGSTALRLAAAQRAHDAGMPLLAADLYRQARDIPGVDVAAVSMKLATALLDAGQAAEAEKVLTELPEPRGASWQLRMGLAALQLRKVEAARAALGAITETELAEADHPWYWFLQGALVDLAPVREVTRANDFYLRAEKAAPTELARAVFQLAAERVRLRLREAVDPKTQLENYEKNRGTRTGYEAAETHAVALDAQGRRGEAVAFLQSALVVLPRQERDWGDRFRLLLGIVGDKSRSGAGRNALNQLVESGHDPLRQRQALQMLAAASTADQERKLLRDLLNKLVALKPDHPIKEALLFYRGQLSLVEKDFLQAESDANALLQQFPRSPLRVHAFGVLTQSAWEQRRFRTAADYAQKALAELAALTAGTLPSTIGRARADLSVLVAEAWFRAGLAFGDKTDFRQSADAYAGVLREHAATLEAPKVGALMFQRVLAEIKAASGAAPKVLDEQAADARFDLANRWQAEWNLARALQLQSEAGVREAYGRVNNLLRDPPGAGGGLKPALHARMAWLQARLAFETNEHETAIRLVDALVATPFAIEATLKADLASEAVLLKAQAQFALGREADGLKTLAQLREDYRRSEAAISSFIIESEHFAAQDKIDQARNRLISLIDDPEYSKAQEVPYALYRLALLSERLGREENLLEANKRIEDSVEAATTRGQTDLIFAARMKQGDIFRKLNDFPRAQRAYEDLVNRYNRRPDVVFAQLELAKTHNAQSSADSAHLDTAQLIFQQLRDRVDAPADVRVEAGYNLGKLLERRGRLPEASRIWWEMLDGVPGAAAGATGPYWLARALRDLGDLFEKQGRIEEAVKAYQQIVDRRLPYGMAVANARLAQLGAVITKPPP